MNTSIEWQAFGMIPRSERVDDGPTVQPIGAPFLAPNLGEASAIGRRRVGRMFVRVKSLAAMRLDGEIP